MYRVRGAALDYLRTLDPASRAARALSRKVARTMSDLVNENKGKAPEEEQIAKRLEMSVDEYRNAMEQLGRVGMNRLEMLDIDEMQSVSNADDILPEERTAKKELQGVVAEAIKTLPERLQLVLALYYQEERSLREIGVILEVSESRVCQLHTEAIHRLRAAAGKE